MRRALRLHPQSVCEAAAKVTVEIARPGPLVLTWRVEGEIAKLIVPDLAASARADGLWRHTCFEAFLGAGDGYVELNFSPSRQWAAYRFSGYREGMAAAEIADPSIETQSAPEWLELRASVDLPPGADGPLGLSAVIEEAGGRLSYWALGHSPGKPDFHHWRAFAMDLPQSERP
jgi:hypothetical protein